MTLFARLHPDNLSALRELSRARCGFITDLTWSPDGFTLAAAHGGGIWIYEGGFAAQPSLVLTEHEGPVKSVAFNPSGMVLISGSTDTTVRLWMPSRGRSFYTFRGHTGGVNAVGVSPNGRVLASAGSDREIRLFDMKESAASNVLRGHTSEITSLAFGLGGRVLISGGWDNTARLWALEETFRCRQHIFEHGDWVRDLAVSPDGRWLASACKDGRLALFDLETCALAGAAHAHDGGIDAVAFSADGVLLASGGRDGALAVWEAGALRAGAAPAPLLRLEAHQKPVLALAFSPNGTMMVSGGGDNAIRLWGVPESA